MEVSFLIEFAAIVFLLITAPFWLPLIGAVIGLALRAGIIIIPIIILLFLFSSF
tara:strand:- start:45 stop:206 length:162 start_codon:yes stop_codon:yes gene_type:complete